MTMLHVAVRAVSHLHARKKIPRSIVREANNSLSVSSSYASRAWRATATAASQPTSSASPHPWRTQPYASLRVLRRPNPSARETREAFLVFALVRAPGGVGAGEGATVDADVGVRSVSRGAAVLATLAGVSCEGAAPEGGVAGCRERDEEGGSPDGSAADAVAGAAASSGAPAAVGCSAAAGCSAAVGCSAAAAGGPTAMPLAVSRWPECVRRRFCTSLATSAARLSHDAAASWRTGGE